MKKFWQVTVLVFGTVLLTGGCSDSAEKNITPRQKVTARLGNIDDCSYYVLADYSLLKTQLKSIWNDAEENIKTVAPEKSDEVAYLRSILGKVFKISGVEHIKAAGISSRCISKSDGSGALRFRNTAVLAVDADSGNLPFICWSKPLDDDASSRIALENFASMVPDDAFFAGAGYMNYAAVLEFVKSVKPLDSEIVTLCKVHAGVTPEVLASSVSGKMTYMFFNDAQTGEISWVVIVPDRDNILFKLCGKYMFFDPETQKEYMLETEHGKMTFRKGENQLYVFMDANGDCAQAYDAKIAAGEVMSKLSIYKSMICGMPEAANSYSVIGLRDASKDNLPVFSALLCEKDAVVSLSNDNHDWNAFPFEIVMNILMNKDSMFDALENNFPMN